MSKHSLKKEHSGVPWDGERCSRKKQGDLLDIRG